MTPLMLAPFLAPLLAPLLLACGDKDVEAQLLTYTDANNYSYNADLTVDTVTTAYATDLTVDWSAVTTDFRGRALNPSDVGWATLIAFSVTKEEVLASINDNSLSQSAIRDYRLFENDDGVTSAQLSQFSVLGNDFLPESEYTEGEGVWTWAVTLWQDNDGRDEILMTIFMDPDKSSDNTLVPMTDDIGTLVFTADLASQPTIPTVAGAEAYLYDWSAATNEASGQEFDSADGDRLILGHTSGSVAEVEANFLTILETADELYRMDTFGVLEADLTLATERDSGAAFPGFTTDGTWLIGIECLSCTSPAPLILSVVEVTE